MRATQGSSSGSPNRVAEPVFLTLDEALYIHADQIRRYGGRSGVRDLGLLSSALAMPAASFGGMRLHTSLGEMAAAYLFHIAQNHPVIDGNRRSALASALAFLWLNGRRLEANDDDLTDLVIGVAAGRVSKAEAAVFIGAHLRPAGSR
jgi:death-on-curing protein